MRASSRARRRTCRSGCGLRRRYRSLPWLLLDAPLVNHAMPHIAARRRFERLVFAVPCMRPRFALAAAVRRQPFRPARPPAALVLGSAREPVLRLLRIRRADPVAAAILGRRVDDARD